MAYDILKYKDFIGSVHYSDADERLVGRIEEIPDIVTFEATSVPELKKAFHAAVDEYIRLCETANKPLRRSFGGTFNVRVTPELHRYAFRCAIEDGISLNQFVQQALQNEVRDRIPHYTGDNEEDQ